MLLQPEFSFYFLLFISALENDVIRFCPFFFFIFFFFKLHKVVKRKNKFFFSPFFQLNLECFGSLVICFFFFLFFLLKQIINSGIVDKNATVPYPRKKSILRNAGTIRFATLPTCPPVRNIPFCRATHFSFPFIL